ncbi:MAG: hypothetical protein HY680_01045 [Chloroflexi bacterium]|nr:hypothetical protein [Chloroflexota bacterium]
MGKAILLVVTNCTDPSKEKEFNDWYTYMHGEDVLKTPGFKLLRRYKGSAIPAMPGREAPGEYVAVWEIESDNLAETMTALTQQMRQPGNRPTPPYLEVKVFKTFEQVGQYPA